MAAVVAKMDRDTHQEDGKAGKEEPELCCFRLCIWAAMVRCCVLEKRVLPSTNSSWESLTELPRGIFLLTSESMTLTLKINHNMVNTLPMGI